VNRYVYLLLHNSGPGVLDVLDEAGLLLVVSFNRAEVESVEDVVDRLVSIFLELYEVKLSKCFLGRLKFVR
jgi:hypothetical protein